MPPARCALDAEREPVLGPPIYGRYYAGRNQVGTAQPPTWLDELNLDPRERVVAALGTRVIQEQQEELMAEAWDQAGEMAKVNQRLRQMQLSLAITSRLHARHVQRIDDDDTLWRFASPAQARLVMAAPANAGAGHDALDARRVVDADRCSRRRAMRRLSRPSRRDQPARGDRGAHWRACRRRRRPAALAGISSMFRLYGAQPLSHDLHAAADPRLVSFDAVTSRLPAGAAAMTFARGTDATVASDAAAVPTFAITRRAGRDRSSTGARFGGAVAAASVTSA